tara:strand:- start:98 stop:457 length:360 start_codon:yes stop_codon:yes gene_type:complete
MSGTSSDITIECEPINVSGEIEIEKVNKLSFNPFMNRKVSNDKSDKEKKSMVLGLIFLTISLPFLIIIINKMFILVISGDFSDENINNIIGNKYWFGGYCVVFVSFFIPAILGLTKQLD